MITEAIAFAGLAGIVAGVTWAVRASRERTRVARLRQVHERLINWNY